MHSSIEKRQSIQDVVPRRITFPTYIGTATTAKPNNMEVSGLEIDEIRLENDT